jgi:predicted alternative tryptophan synthase beta-subunit
VILSQGVIMPDTVKYLLDESRIPKFWYNLIADLPSPPPAVLHPGTLQPVGPGDLEPLFPMSLIMQEVTGEREVEIPEPVREVYKPMAADAALSRAAIGEGARYAGAHLLQIRGRESGGQP